MGHCTGTPTGGASARMTSTSPAPAQMPVHRPTQPTVGADVPYLPRRGVPAFMRAKPQHVHGDQGREDQSKVRETLVTMATSLKISQTSTHPEDAINYNEDSGILVDGVPAGQSLSMMRADDSRMAAFFGAPAQPRGTTFDLVSKIGRGSRAPLPYSRSPTAVGLPFSRSPTAVYKPAPLPFSRSPTAVYQPISMKDDLLAKYSRPEQRPTFKSKILKDFSMPRRMDSSGLPAFTSLKTSGRTTLPASPPSGQRSPAGGRMARAAPRSGPKLFPDLQTPMVRYTITRRPSWRTNTRGTMSPTRTKYAVSEEASCSNHAELRL